MDYFIQSFMFSRKLFVNSYVTFHELKNRSKYPAFLCNIYHQIRLLNQETISTVNDLYSASLTLSVYVYFFRSLNLRSGLLWEIIDIRCSLTITFNNHFYWFSENIGKIK